MTYFWKLSAISLGLLACGVANAELSEARPSSFWSWLNGYVDHNQITRELEMKAKGMRGGILPLPEKTSEHHQVVAVLAVPDQANKSVDGSDKSIRLEIAVTNLWNNRIVGDLQPDSNRTFTHTNLKSKLHPQSPLLPSGLIGPVMLDFPVTVTAKSQK